MAKVVITAPAYFSPKSRQMLERLGDVEARYFAPNEIDDHLADCKVLCVRVETQVNRDLLNQAPTLRVVLSGTTGVNHIDTEALDKRDIRLFHLHGEHTLPTAEHAFGLLLALARNLRPACDAVLQGEWARHRFIGRELRGLTLGIVGIGKIGTEVAQLAGGFGMSVLAYDPYVDAGEVQARGAGKVESLDGLVSHVNALTLHCPLTEETAGMIDGDLLAQLEDGGYLVNAARAGIVVEEHLMAEISSGRIAAAIDVFNPEPPGDGPLVQCARRHGNLILTPHLGASTRQAVERASEGLARQALDHFGTSNTVRRPRQADG